MERTRGHPINRRTGPKFSGTAGDPNIPLLRGSISYYSNPRYVGGPITQNIGLDHEGNTTGWVRSMLAKRVCST